MNYRRGLQRIYIVLSVTWIGILLFALPADRLKFWIKPFTPPPLSSHEGPAKDEFGGIAVPEDKALSAQFDNSIKSGDWKIWAQEDSPESRLQKTTWLAGVLFGPPMLGYALIFFVIPWIYRGFRQVVN